MSNAGDPFGQITPTSTGPVSLKVPMLSTTRGVFFEDHGGDIFCDDVHGNGCFLPVDIKDGRLLRIRYVRRPKTKTKPERNIQKNFVLRLFI